MGSTFIGVRVPPDQVERVDRWIAAQDEHLSRPEALRRLAERGLQAEEDE